MDRSYVPLTTTAPKIFPRGEDDDDRQRATVERVLLKGVEDLYRDLVSFGARIVRTIRVKDRLSRLFEHRPEQLHEPNGRRYVEGALRAVDLIVIVVLSDSRQGFGVVQQELLMVLEGGYGIVQQSFVKISSSQAAE